MFNSTCCLPSAQLPQRHPSSWTALSTVANLDKLPNAKYCSRFRPAWCKAMTTARACLSCRTRLSSIPGAAPDSSSPNRRPLHCHHVAQAYVYMSAERTSPACALCETGRQPCRCSVISLQEALDVLQRVSEQLPDGMPPLPGCSADLQSAYRMKWQQMLRRCAPRLISSPSPCRVEVRSRHDACLRGHRRSCEEHESDPGRPKGAWPTYRTRRTSWAGRSCAEAAKPK
jgi:hypothetical protein